ncbi:MAG: TonB-dependent receptor [Planctomycetes bacterium]|nr:TonB-dependent receptor [Planctomycetota bacterium]
MKLLQLLFAAGLVAAPASLLAQDGTDTPPPPKEDTTDITVVTPSGSEGSRMKVADAINVLDRRDIQERLVGQTPDIVAGTTGVYGQNTAVGQGSPFIRGMTGNSVLTLVDGVRFNNSTFRFGPNQYLSSIDPYTIERIEIIRGPSSVLYGSDALGGVINIILKKPKFGEFDYSFGARARFESASLRKQAGLFGEVNTMNFGGLINATFADIDEQVGGNSIGRQPFTAYEEWGTFGSFGAAFGQHTIIGTYSHFQQNDLERTDKVSPIVANPGNLSTPGRGNEDRRRFVYQIDDMGIVRWTWSPEDVLEQLFVDLSYHKQQETLERIKQGSSTIRDINYNVHTFGLNTQAVLNLGWYSRLTVGAEAYHDVIHTRSVDRDKDTGAQSNHDGRLTFPDWSGYTSIGVYAQNEMEFLDEMILLRYGLRYSFYRAIADTDIYGDTLDGLNESYSDLTGAVAMVVRPIDEFSITLNLAKGFRAPNMDDLAASKGTGRGDQIPNPGLDPEIQYSADIGTKVLIPTINSNSAAPYELSGSVNFFFSYFEDLMISVDTVFNAEDVVQLRNEGRARIFGVEAELGFYLSEALGWIGLPTDHLFFEGDALGVRGNFTYTRGDDLKNDVPVHRIPPVFSEISVRYSAMWGQVFIEPYVTIVGRQDQYAPSALGDVRFTPHDAPGYVLFGLRSGWAPSRHFHVNLNIQNLGNRSYHPMGSGTFGSGTNVVLSGEVRW